MELIKSISGIRGIVNQTLNKTTVNIYSNIFTSLQPTGDILLARDSRPHGKELYNSIADTLTSMGRNVIDCGIIPTPTAQFIIKNKKLSGGIVVTASHNPVEWNGLKFLDSDGCFLNANKMKKLLSGIPKETTNNKGKVIESRNSYQDHIDNILNLNCIDIDKIKSKKFKVALDTVNGAAYKALPELLNALNCNIVKIHCNNDGTFPRGTEPIPSHLEDLSKTVVNHKADIGFATDPDADRLAIVDNHGKPIGEESTLVLALESYLKYYQGSQKVVTNLSTSMAVDVIAHQYNSTVERSSVGEINVVEKMKELESTIGGEGNGGVILKESHLGRDSLVASALILNHLAQSDIPFDKILESTPRFTMIKDKITLQHDVDFNHIKFLFKNDDVSFIENDGLKVSWKDKWVHIRKSNTEPIIRIISEADTYEKAKNLIYHLKKNIIS
ncbi:MAG: phosphoglucosamine mutase [Candidatus Marinimicrobia bacterium]|nr:phosphoglucosamine mutase [Candidatus Neomarinimicrobiota bacterium]